MSYTLSYSLFFTILLHGSGKNVCLKDLLGTCKFGATRCVYSHAKVSRAMPSNGWWHDPEQVASAKQIFTFAEQETTDVGAFNSLVRHLPGVHGVAGRASRKIIAKHIKENAALVSKAEPKAKSPVKTTIPTSTRFVLLLSLENQEFFSSIQEHFLKAIRAKVKIVQVKSLTESLCSWHRLTLQLSLLRTLESSSVKTERLLQVRQAGWLGCHRRQLCFIYFWSQNGSLQFPPNI